MRIGRYFAAGRHRVIGSKRRSPITAMVAIAVMAMGLVFAPAAFADTHTHPHLTKQPFTPAELAANWHPDRTTPSGGYSSVHFEHRANVLEMNVDNTKASTSGVFYQTEGLQRALPNVNTVQADLYVDPAWLPGEDSGPGKQVRAGLWGVAYNSAGSGSTGNITAYPILEFTTVGAGGFTGWRVWDGVHGGWTNLPQVRYHVGEWNRIRLTFNVKTVKFDVYVNDRYVTSTAATDGTAAGTTASIGAVILNQFNFATGNHADDYSVRWCRLAYGTASRRGDGEHED